MIKDSIYKSPWHQFTHTDIFSDVEKRIFQHPIDFMEAYLSIILGADPDKLDITAFPVVGTVKEQTFMYAVQCLAVAETRRYHVHEAKFGGRFLPFRFAAGIAEGLWTAADASDKQKRGRPGVEWLEKDYGVPTLTKKLMDKD